MKNKKERQLVAIMFTDMVGYSSLTQEDEALALELLEEHRQILRPFFPKSGGREVETIGDAFFVEFSSALEAVKCAVDIQKTLWERNRDLPDKRHIKIRIGIHLGDIVRIGDNVLGDEVNIAARIEPLAQTGGISVSEDIARQVQNKLEFTLKKIEIKELKNIKIPVKVYAVILNWLEEPPNLQSPIKRNKIAIYLAVVISIILLIIIGYKLVIWNIPEESAQMNDPEWQNSIAVLPFTDLSPNKDHEYFGDGMTEQILTNLAQLKKLKVIARTSVMKFKDTHKTIPEIGEELNVDHILEGSIRKFENQLRVTAQLVKSADGSHIWAENYDREYADLFEIQDDISKAIADKLSEKLSVKEFEVIKTKRTINLEAYEYYLKGVFLNRNKYWITFNIEDLKDSEQMFLKAIELDPGYAPTYAELADLYNTHWSRLTLDAEEKQKYLDLQEKYIKIAFELDSMSAIVNRVMGWVSFAKNKETEEIIAFMKKAVKLDVNDPENIRSLGIIYDIIGLKNLASMSYDRCIDLDPLDVKNYYYRANIHLNMGQFQKAKSDLQKALILEQNDPRFLLLYTWLLFLTEEYDEAEILCSKYNQLYPNTSQNRFLRAVLLAKNGEKEKALALDLPPITKIMIFLYLKMDEEAIQHLKNSSKQLKQSKRSEYLYLKNHPIYDFLRSDLRFQEIMIKHKEVYDENLRKYGAIDW